MRREPGPVDPGRRSQTAWLTRWSLSAVADATVTASSILTPVVMTDGTPAMLKVATNEEERRGGELLAALDGRGVARVLQSLGPAVLLERATGKRSLVRMAEGGDDDAATRVLCAAADGIHAATAQVRSAPRSPELVPLEVWFGELFAGADRLGPVHRRCADLARALIGEQRDERVLHGDLHHGNVLDFGERGWLAIDPKGLLGERTFDYCNLFCNPSHEFALQPGRLEHRLEVVAGAARLDRGRLAAWVATWCALSSTWFTIDRSPATAASALRLAERALAVLDGPESHRPGHSR